jgi:signal transduction histidine kinase
MDQSAALAGRKFVSEYRVGVGDRWCESRGNAVLDEAGRLVKIVGVVRDITERHRLDEFRQLFPILVAHDIRSPLSNIKMASAALQESVTVPAATTGYPQMILRSVDRIVRLADQLLDFAEAQFGGGLRLKVDDGNDRAPS